MKGISESVKNICRKKGIQVHFKPSKTIRNVLVKPKDKDSKGQKCGIIYHIKCAEPTCSDSYVGETGRTLAERTSEHSKPPSALHMHHTDQGHPLPSLDHTSILSGEPNKFRRYVKESIFIRAVDPSLNKNVGKYELPHCWDNVIKKDNALMHHNS